MTGSESAIVPIPITMLFARRSDFPAQLPPPPRYDPATQTGDRVQAFGDGSWCSGSSTGTEMFGGGDTDTYRDD